ncbi:hypothetical protein OF846_000089 [Rhodotorula toruloides]|nr:hypothetical protein OF846_000089 [Rhodotorula toruloides]
MGGGRRLSQADRGGYPSTARTCSIVDATATQTRLITTSAVTRRVLRLHLRWSSRQDGNGTARRRSARRYTSGWRRGRGSYRSSLTSVVGAVCNRRTRSGNRHSTIFRPSTPRRDAGPAHLLRPPLLSLPTCYALHFRHTRLTGCATAAAAPVSLVSLDMRSF